MNTLTKNRIIEDGDEYLDKDGKWKAVLKQHLGMQIMFTDLKEVRRPKESPQTEKCAKVISRNEEPISPDSRELAKASPVAKAESDNTAPVSSHSDTGVTLPTVVSAKAHSKVKGLLAPVPKVLLMPTGRSDAYVEYPNGSNLARWIGRNGTFNALGLNLHKIDTFSGKGLVRIVPQGRRGEAKNALIEFPVEVIPLIIHWLKGQQV